MEDCPVGMLLDFSELPKPAKPETEKVIDNQDKNNYDGENAESTLKALRNVEASGNEKCELLLQSMANISIEEARSDNPPQNIDIAEIWEEVIPIEDEIFDFDLPASPLSGKNTPKDVDHVPEKYDDEDDEIFFGPVGFMENVVSKAVEIEEAESKDAQPLEPLSAEEMVQLFKEAQTVAFYINKAGSNTPKKSKPDQIEAPEIIISQSVPETTSNMENQETKVPEKSLERNTSKAPGSIKSKANGPFRLSLRPLQNMTECLDKVLPKAKLPIDSEGVFRFAAKAKVSPNDEQKKIIGSKLRGKGLQRATSLRLPGKKSDVTSGLPLKGVLRPPVSKQPRKVSPQKRRRTGLDSSMDDETSSIASDISDSSSCGSIPVPGKRKLMEPGYNHKASGLPSAGSRLALPSDRQRSLSGVSTRGSGMVQPSSRNRTLSNSSTASNTSHNTISPPSDIEKKVSGLRPLEKSGIPASGSSSKPSGLARPGSIAAPSMLQKPAIKGAMTKLELLKPGALQRKTLTVNRSKLAQAVPGPVKAVGPTSTDMAAPPKPQPLKPNNINTVTPRKAKPVPENPVFEATPKKKKVPTATLR